MDKTLTLISKPGTTMEDLAPGVIQEILSRLPIKSLLGSRCVCPIWRNLIKEPHLANIHLTQASLNQNPGFIFRTCKNELYAMPDLETYDAVIKLTNLPFKSWLPIFKLIGSCNGFLCLADNTHKYRSIFVCNPLTGEYIKLPDYGTLGKVNGAYFGFGFNHDKKQYKVVRMRSVANKEPLEVEVHTLGTDSWRTIGILPNNGKHLQCPGVLAEENLHWWDFHNSLEVKSIISFNLRDEKLRSIQPPPSVVGKKQISIHLESFGGHLYVVDNSFCERVEVWVMRDYGVGESWTKEFVIQMPVVRSSRLRMKQILGIQKDGKILMKCNDRVLLFLYDPQSERFKDLKIRGLPRIFNSVPHIASLVLLKDAIVTERQ